MAPRYTAWDLRNGVKGRRYTVREVRTGRHTGRYATYKEAQEAARKANQSQ